jgi:hypothetical protein
MPRAGSTFPFPPVRSGSSHPSRPARLQGVWAKRLCCRSCGSHTRCHAWASRVPYDRTCKLPPWLMRTNALKPAAAKQHGFGPPCRVLAHNLVSQAIRISAHQTRGLGKRKPATAYCNLIIFGCQGNFVCEHVLFGPDVAPQHCPSHHPTLG